MLRFGSGFRLGGPKCFPFSGLRTWATLLMESWVGVGLRVLFKDAGPLVWRRLIRPGLKSYLLQITIGSLSKHTNITTGGVNIEQVVSFINF